MKENSTKKPLEYNIKLDRKIIILLVLYLLLVFLSPIILTQITTFVGFNEDTGFIGDTIGGITAPFINLLAAFLVFISFKEQIKANQQLNKENELNYITNLFQLIKSDFLERNYTVHKNQKISNLSFIYRWMLSVNDKNRFISNLNLGYKEDDSLNMYNEDFRRNEINNKIREPFQASKNLIFLLHELTNEIKKSNLESGLKTYYKFQIEKMLYDLDLWLLLNPAFFKRLEEHNILQGLEIKAAYRDCKIFAEVLSKKGYKVRSKLG